MNIREKILGTKHRQTAESYYIISSVLLFNGYYDLSLEYLEKALKIQEE